LRSFEKKETTLRQKGEMYHFIVKTVKTWLKPQEKNQNNTPLRVINVKVKM